MRVTVCQLPDPSAGLTAAWADLVGHVTATRSDLVVLPEMPFASWPCRRRRFDAGIWAKAVSRHEEWLERFGELGSVGVAGTRPIAADGARHNEAYVWKESAGLRPAHRKRHLPDEPGFWEASWYDPGPVEPAPIGVSNAVVGFLVCTELWFGRHARRYARDGVHLVCAPRATPAESAGKWLAGGRTAAVVAGAFCASSNRAGVDGHGMVWAGRGWVIDPDGEVLALTSNAVPFVTVDVDPAVAEAAKRTYPRYVAE